MTLFDQLKATKKTISIWITQSLIGEHLLSMDKFQKKFYHNILKVKWN